MARRNNIYEIALEHALRLREVPLVAIAESERADAAGRSFKNFDYLLYRSEGAHWICEVKGRKVTEKRSGDPWIQAQDLACLDGWRAVFGGDFEPLFVFVFDVSAAPHEEAHHQAFGRRWQFWQVFHRDYQRLARMRSPRWRTLALSATA
ncbi:MAG: HYExAFE family protein, partial [Planctomycetes bacterium]|nr:HYExAFE family protein [Planctomycetota bacterium]